MVERPRANESERRPFFRFAENLRAALSAEAPVHGRAAVGFAHVVRERTRNRHILFTEKRADRALVLDDSYIPPVLDVAASKPLAAFRSELLGLLHQRGEALAGRVVASGAGGASEIADFMLLQLVNRAEPLINHLSQLSPLHPERFYSELVSLAGEFATFSTAGRRPTEYPQYQHDALALSFAPVMQALREAA